MKKFDEDGAMLMPSLFDLYQIAETNATVKQALSSYERHTYSLEQALMVMVVCLDSQLDQTQGILDILMAKYHDNSR